MSVATDVISRPILFSGPMVRAVIDGRKTQTRRVCKNPKVAGPYGIQLADRVVKYEPVGLPPEWSFRRPIQYPTPNDLPDGVESVGLVRCPFGLVGDRLWVRETWQSVPPGPHRDWPGIDSLRPRKASEFNRACVVIYSADGAMPGDEAWRPSIHMPRWASRITLEITAVRVERLNEIGEDDARAEGVEWNEGPFRAGHTNHISAFRSLWDSINGKRPGCSWESNPWVWCISFRRLNP